MNKKKNIFFDWITPAQAQEEGDRIEQLLEERHTSRRLAHETFLIQARAAQDEQQKREEQLQMVYDRERWDETMLAIQIIHSAYELGE